MRHKKVFLISFNKCATTSFYHMFEKNGYKSLHHNKLKSKKRTYLAQVILDNKSKNRDALLGLGDYISYCDFTMLNDNTFIDVTDVFDYLYAHYPNEYYIFFDRPVDSWTKSRLNHIGFLNRYMNVKKLNKQQSVLQWKKDYDQYKNKILKEFKDKKNFLYYNIVEDDIQSLIDFLPEYNLNKSYWGHHNLSKQK